MLNAGHYLVNGAPVDVQHVVDCLVRPRNMVKLDYNPDHYIFPDVKFSGGRNSKKAFNTRVSVKDLM